MHVAKGTHLYICIINIHIAIKFSFLNKNSDISYGEILLAMGYKNFE